MSDQIQILIAFLLYISLFAWIGYRRGTWREAVILIISVGGYVTLQEFSGILIRVINLGWRFLAFARSGGLTSDDPEAILALRDQPALVTPDNQQTVLFLIWATLLILGYMLTGKWIANQKSKSNFMAGLLGITNGLFYIAILLPRLVALILPDADLPGDLAEAGIRQVLRSTVDVLEGGIRNLWASVGDQQPLLVLLIITTILVVAASTLYGSRRRSQT